MGRTILLSSLILFTLPLRQAQSAEWDVYPGQLTQTFLNGLAQGDEVFIHGTHTLDLPPPCDDLGSLPSYCHYLELRIPQVTFTFLDGAQLIANPPPWGDPVDDGDGIAAFHSKCFEKAGRVVPTTISDDDPDQGWGNMRKRFMG